jgi:hypothetical protein
MPAGSRVTDVAGTRRRPPLLRRTLVGVTAACLVALGLSAVGSHDIAEAAVTRTGSCVDGGRVAWISKVTWGSPYKGSDGVTRISVNYAGWTTTKTGTVPTDSVVKSYDGSGKLLQTLTRVARFDYGAGIRYDYRNPLNPPSAPGKAKITVRAGVDGDGHAGCTVTYTQPSSSTSAASDPVVAAAGDIACAPGSTVGTSCRHRAVSDKILADTAVGTVLMLGDAQYPNGTLADFKASYDPTWGRLKSKTRPVPGNHEYNTAGAAGYYDYFGSRAGDRSKGYYSFNLGTWHVVALNSEKDTAATGTQMAWLKSDLKAHPNRCTLAIYHTPRWSGGEEHGDSTVVAPFVQALYDANADIILNGHDHNYERFYPLNPSGVRDNVRGITQIVSGLGGRSTRPVTPRATTAASNASSYGYSRLVLRDGSADVSYRSAVGSYSDSTKVTCH